MNGILIKAISTMLFSVTVVYSQCDEIDFNMLSQRYNVTHEIGGIQKLQDKLTGRTTYKTENIKSIPPDYDFDLIVDLRTIDITQYSKIFTFWTEIPPYYVRHLPLIIADANNDGRKDIYGAYKSFYSDGSIVIYEINLNGSYDSVYKYPDSLGWPWCIGDLENDGNIEIVNSYIYHFPTGYNHYIKILSIDSVTEYPTQLKTIYDPTTGNGQPLDMTLYDMDGDKYPEMIYYLDGEGDSLVLSNSFQIARYDRANNEFSLVYQNRPSNYTIHTRGFTFGDFDSDGGQNFAVSNYLGEVFVYEHTEGNNYNVIRIDSLPISNVYLQLFTNDLNHNGKPELWICGDGYINGVGSQIIYIYEANGDDQYNIIYSIAVIGGSTWYASSMVSADIDNDGTDEVLLCIDQHLLVFKNILDGYELYYIKRNELLNQNSNYISATIADFDKDNYPEIILSMDLVENNALRGFSRIYKKTSTLNVLDKNSEPYNYYLSEAYPNPFNPSTNIAYSIPQYGLVTIKVYNSLGEEAAVLVNEEKPAGAYEVKFYGGSLPSGVYVYRMTAGSYATARKMVLVK